MRAITFDEYMVSLPIERQKRINDRAAKLIAEIDSELPSAVANAFEE